MKFEPKTEEEINAGNLLEGGDYDFEVAKAEEAVSKKGNEMVKLTIHIMDNEDRRHTVFDYLVSSDESAFKLRGFAESVGLLEQYEAGEIRAEQMEGRAGSCKIGIDDKDKSYPAKNVVRAYLKPKAPASAMNGAKKGSSAQILDDDVPFAPEWR